MAKLNTKTQYTPARQTRLLKLKKHEKHEKHVFG